MSKKNEELAKIDGMVNMDGDKSFNRFQTEMQKLAKKTRVDANTITVKEFADHKNISVWTREGKRIGPLHPHNAKKVLQMSYEKGIPLQVDQPTPEEVEAYKNTKEYKDKEKAYKLVRDRKKKSLKKENMNQIAEAIAKMSGQTVEALTNILTPDQVGKVKPE